MIEGLPRSIAQEVVGRPHALEGANPEAHASAVGSDVREDAPTMLSDHIERGQYIILSEPLRRSDDQKASPLDEFEARRYSGMPNPLIHSSLSLFGSTLALPILATQVSHSE